MPADDRQAAGSERRWKREIEMANAHPDIDSRVRKGIIAVIVQSCIKVSNS
jgi:hypothetical protein